MPLNALFELVQTFDRMEAVFTPSKIAADLANSPGGPLGEEARAWTHDLLVQRADSNNAIELTVSRALLETASNDAIAHGRAAYTLIQIVLAYAQETGRAPNDGEIAFLLLALNDHIPCWENDTLSGTEDLVAVVCAESIFNQTFDDPLRFVVRQEAIFGAAPVNASMSDTEWNELQQAAFGCSFGEYLELYLAPMLIISRGWGASNPPVIFREP